MHDFLEVIIQIVFVEDEDGLLYYQSVKRFPACNVKHGCPPGLWNLRAHECWRLSTDGHPRETQEWPEHQLLSSSAGTALGFPFYPTVS